MSALRRVLLLAVTAGLILQPDLFAPLLRPFAPEGGPVIYDRASLAGLAGAHLLLVLAAMLPSTLIALSLAILVTRPAGAGLLPMARTLANIGQTIPPVATPSLLVPRPT